MLLQTIIEVVPKFIEECNRLTAARRSGRFSNKHGSLCALHMSLNNASLRTVHKWWKRNN